MTVLQGNSQVKLNLSLEPFCEMTDSLIHSPLYVLKSKKIGSHMHCQQGKILWYPFYGPDNNRALQSLSSSFSFKSFSVLTYFTKKQILSLLEATL